MEGREEVMSILEKKYDVVLVDFKECIYLSSENTFTEFDEMTWSVARYVRGSGIYDKTMLNMPLLHYLSKCESRVYLMCSEKFGSGVEYDFLNSVMPGVLTGQMFTPTAESRVDLAEVMIRSGVSRNDILVISDNSDTVKYCKIAKIESVRPQYIMDRVFRSIVGEMFQVG